MKVPFLGRTTHEGGDVSSEVFVPPADAPNLTSQARPTKLLEDEGPVFDDNKQPTDPWIKKVYNQVKRDGNLNGLIDALLDLPEKRIMKRMNKMIADNPHITASQLSEQLAKSYIQQAGLSSGAVGAVAAAPGAGTAVAAGVTLAEFVAFAAESTFYILSVSQLCGVSSHDKERRRALVMSSLLGTEGAKLVSDQLGLATLHWARTSLMNMTSPTLGTVNKMLVKYAQKTYAKRMSGRFLGKLIPFGIGAAVGWFSGRSIARNVIEGTRAALGDPHDIAAQNILALNNK